MVPSAPDDVLAVLLELPPISNVTIQRQMLEIACQLPGPLSAKLKEALLSVGKDDIHFLSYNYLDLLTHWVTQDQVEPALELADGLLRFESALQFGYRHSTPVRPRLDEWLYRQVIERAIFPLTEKHPDAVVQLLLDVTDEMIILTQLTQLQEAKGGEDHSEIWCRRLDNVDDGLDEPATSWSKV